MSPNFLMWGKQMLKFRWTNLAAHLASSEGRYSDVKFRLDHGLLPLPSKCGHYADSWTLVMFSLTSSKAKDFLKLILKFDQVVTSARSINHPAIWTVNNEILWFQTTSGRPQTTPFVLIERPLVLEKTTAAAIMLIIIIVIITNVAASGIYGV